MQPPTRATPLPILLALTLLAASAEPARAAVSAAVAGGILTIGADAADDVAVACVGTMTKHVKVNGADPSPGPTLCGAVTRITVTATGTFANAIDLSAVNAAAGFTGLPAVQHGILPQAAPFGITVDAGPGDDTVAAPTNSSVETEVRGGAGDDLLVNASGRVSFYFADAAAPEVDTIDASPAQGASALNFVDVSAGGVTVDLNGGLGGDPLAIASHANRVVKLQTAGAAERFGWIQGTQQGDSIHTHDTAGAVLTGLGSGTYNIIDGRAGDDVFVGGPRNELWGFVENAGTKTLTDTGGLNYLGFCAVLPALGVTIDLTGGLGGATIARVDDLSTIVQLADPGDTATRDALFRLEGGQGDDLLIGSASPNFFTDCGGDDVMRGGPGNDIFDETFALVEFQSGDDRYEGGDGDDVYRVYCNAQPGLETDTLVELPGEGDDTLNFASATGCVAGQIVRADLRSDAALAEIGPSGGPVRHLLQTGAAGQAEAFEDLIGSPSTGDELLGNGADNVIVAGLDDLVSGGGGDDLLFGNCIVTYALAPGPVYVDLRNNVVTGDGTDTLDGTRRVIGSPFDDVMIGDNSFGLVSELSGGAGNDTIIASGDDIVRGDAGMDLLQVSGAVTVFGGDDADTFVIGGFGGTYHGEGGDDMFFVSGGNHTLHGGAGTDTIDARNERADVVDCADGADVVLGDQLDTVAGDCESLNPGPAPDPRSDPVALVSCGAEAPTFAGMSADGTHVFFTTPEALVPADADAAVDLYERVGAQLRLVSGGAAAIDVAFAGASTDGTHVFFTTAEALLPADTDTALDLYERTGGQLRLVSGGTANVPIADGLGGISPDGTRAFFVTAEALLPADTDAEPDLYERSGGMLHLVSGPTAAAGTSIFFDALSADGTRVWFSTSKALVPADTETVLDVYERNAGGLTLVSDVPFVPTAFAEIPLFAGASADGTKVFLNTIDFLPGFQTFGIHVNDAGTISLLQASDTGVSIIAVSDDGDRVIFGTADPLAPEDVDQSADLYVQEGGVDTLLTGGTADLAPSFRAASPDATRVLFDTAEALLPEDVDLTLDLYESAGGTLRLVTPGATHVPATFKATTADPDRVLFATGEALDAADVDVGIDVYTTLPGGGVELAASGASLTTFFDGAAADGSVVIFHTDQVLRPADGDATFDLYAVGPTGFPEDPVCTFGGENCGNCVDDDGDMLVDRADDDCPAPADGGGMALADPKLQGKPALKCEKALGKAGTKLAAEVQKRLQKCLGAAFACVQQKGAADACRAKAAATCAKQLGGLAKARVKLDAGIGKACGAAKLAPVDLLGLAGLGHGEEEALCATLGVPALASSADVAACVRAVHECRAQALVGQQVPRAAELLAFAGRDPGSELPCLPAGADGMTQALGDPKTAGKAAVKCQGALAKGGAKFVLQKQKLVQKCTQAVAACMQTKPGAALAPCLAKAEGKCAKAFAKLTAPGKGLEAKLGAAIAKACAVPAVGVAGLLDPAGLGFGAHAAECAGLGVPALAAVSDVAECVTRLHECRAEQLLESQTPRLYELLDLAGATLP